MQKNRLSKMELNSVDLVERGAAQRAEIKLFKSDTGKEVNSMKNRAQSGYFARIGKAISDALGLDVEDTCPEQEIEDIAKAWSESCSSIWNDTALTAGEKQVLFEKSLSEFTALTKEMLPAWAGTHGGKKEKRLVDSEASEEDESDFDTEDNSANTDKTVESASKQQKKESCKFNKQEEEENMALIDVAKMSPEDRAILAELQKKYAPEETCEEAGGEVTKTQAEIAPLHPEVAKALDEIRAENILLKKSMEMKELTDVAGKYECLGKKTVDTAEKLYIAKQAGGTAYDDLIGLMDELVTMQERSGIFKELGTSASGGGDLAAAVAEIKKAEPTLTHAQAVIKAYELNPTISQY